MKYALFAALVLASCSQPALAFGQGPWNVFAQPTAAQPQRPPAKAAKKPFWGHHARKRQPSHQ